MKNNSLLVRFSFTVAIFFALLLAVVPVALAEGENDPLEEAQEKAVSWYKENHNPPDSWEGLPGLWGAGEDLSASPWETTQDWRDDDYEHDTDSHWHVKYIFKLLSAGMDPSDAWGGTNLFKELSGLQKENGEFEGYSDAAHSWPLVALDIGKERGLDVGSWDENSQEKAVEYLLTKQKDDGSFTDFGVDITGDYLVALSNYTDDQDVEDAVGDAVDYLKNVQDDDAFFPGWGERNSNSQSKAISGLVAVGEDLLDPDGNWVRDGNTPIDALLEFQQDDGQFHYKFNDPGVGTMAQDDALVALSCIINESSTWHRMGEIETVTVDLRASGIAGDIFDEEDLEIPAGEVTVDDFTLNKHTAMGALAYYCKQYSINIEITEGDWGRYVYQIGDDSDDEDSWVYYVDQSSPLVGADQYELSEGEAVHFVNFNLSLYSLSMSIEPESIAPGDNVTTTVVYIDGDGKENPAEGAEIYYTNELDDFGSPVAGSLLEDVNTDDEGKASFTWDDEGAYYFYAQWDVKSSQYQWPVVSLDCFYENRLFGSGRYETAVDISKDAWDSADTVVLARSDCYADALAGVPLAYYLNAPILLTSTASLHSATEDEIDRLEANKIILLGGTSAISDEVKEGLEKKDLEVDRIYGSNRYETAVEIADRLAEEVEVAFETAFIAVGDDFADALAASSYAAKRGEPILLVKEDERPDATRQALDELGIKSTYVSGGPGAISEEVYNELPNPTRIYGDDRYGTALALAEEFLPDEANRVGIATGRAFPDAIAGGVWAASQDTGILLVDGDGSEPREVIADFFNDQGIIGVNIFGGPAAISSNMAGWFEDNLSDDE